MPPQKSTAEQILAFQRDVAKVVTKLATPFPKELPPGHPPDYWLLDNRGIMALYEFDAGRIFTVASSLMESHKLELVTVAVPFLDAIPPFLRKSLAKAGIGVGSVAEVKEALKWPFPRGKDKKKRKSPVRKRAATTKAA